jgi:hypothetical protein
LTTNLFSTMYSLILQRKCTDEKSARSKHSHLGRAQKICLTKVRKSSKAVHGVRTTSLEIKLQMAGYYGKTNLVVRRPLNTCITFFMTAQNHIVFKVFYLEFVMCHVAGMAKEDPVLTGLIEKKHFCKKCSNHPGTCLPYIYKIRNSFITRTRLIYF